MLGSFGVGIRTGVDLEDESGIADRVGAGDDGDTGGTSLAETGALSIHGRRGAAVVFTHSRSARVRAHDSFAF